jgi:hypothetical protein
LIHHEVEKLEREGTGFGVRFKPSNGRQVLTNFSDPVRGSELAGEVVFSSQQWA